MISVDSLGRMGNQMFQLAFGHAASRRLRTSFVFGPGALWEYFDLGPWGTRRVRLARKLEFRLRYGRRPTERVVVDNDADPAEVVAGLRDGVAYSGFFQSERFFDGCDDEIRDLYRIHERHQLDFASRYPKTDPYVCIHVRRGDYLENGWALPSSYYVDALEAVNRPDCDVIVVSDDPAIVARELGEALPAKYEINPAIVDLQLLINADAVITSNSSFSWWGAWLNRRPDARVVAPQHWVGFAEQREIPRDVVPARWTTVPVRRDELTRTASKMTRSR